jgi:hypothetical protein
MPQVSAFQNPRLPDITMSQIGHIGCEPGGGERSREVIMATKADFTPDEWKSLLQSPLLVGVAVSAAEPNGLFGMLKESMASARALVQM